MNVQPNSPHVRIDPVLMRHCTGLLKDYTFNLEPKKVSQILKDVASRTIVIYHVYSSHPEAMKQIFTNRSDDPDRNESNSTEETQKLLSFFETLSTEDFENVETIRSFHFDNLSAEDKARFDIGFRVGLEIGYTGLFTKKDP